MQAELEDVYLLMLIALERRAVAAVHAVIPHTGQEPRSEALEHRLEHLIMRKQQLDYPWHASDRKVPLDEEED